MVPLNLDVKDGLALDPLLPLSALAEYQAAGSGPMATTRIPVIGTTSANQKAGYFSIANLIGREQDFLSQ